jgi:hypothetical protein
MKSLFLSLFVQDSTESIFRQVGADVLVKAFRDRGGNGRSLEIQFGIDSKQ